MARWLSRHGVAKYEVRRVSRGEKDAVGTSPKGWAYDRRVDIVLIK